MTEKLSYTVQEFCAANGISRSLLYELWRRGIGPRRMRVGSHLRISAEAAAAWRRACEDREGDAA